MSTPHTYGWRPDRPDFRDLHYAPPAALTLSLPPYTDQRENHPPIYDQGALGSCTFNAGADIVEYLMRTGRVRDNTGVVFRPSRLAGYYDERVLEGTVDWDSGAQIRDALKVIAKNGVGPEDQPDNPANWPYDISKFKVRPPQAYYTEAEKHQGLAYARVAQNECVMKGVLASGFPIIYGFTVYESFESPAVASTGIVPMPRSGESVLGGHAVVIVGYDDLGAVTPVNGRCAIVRNSWGEGWGDKGHCYFPWEYLLNGDLADDFWVLKTIE